MRTRTLPFLTAATRTRPCLPALAGAALLALAGCGDRFSPDTYATRAVQQADKVEQGIIVGVRQVRISAEGSTGAATGAAAGGVIGAQAPGVASSPRWAASAAHWSAASWARPPSTPSSTPMPTNTSCVPAATS